MLKEEFDISELDEEPETQVTSFLASFNSGHLEDAILAVLAKANDMESASTVITEALQEFIQVEAKFNGKIHDDVVHDLKNAENLDVMLSTIRAHDLLTQRSTKLILAVL